MPENSYEQKPKKDDVEVMEGKADLVGLRPGLQQHETALHFAGRPEKAVRGGMQAV